MTKIIYTAITILSIIFMGLSFYNNSNLQIKSPDYSVKTITDKLSLREKIGQMIISNTLGEDYSENSPELNKLKKLCQETKVGGFIFFKGTSRGYANLSNKLQSYSSTPLLISADFERGTRMRVTDGSLFPNNMAIGATDNPKLSYDMGIIVGKECRILGVHQNYAPVCDVNNNPNNPIINVRSYGEDPILVSGMSEMFIKGLQESRVIATAKHFPGHGDTEIDSHNDLPVLPFDIDRLNKIELVPFKNAIDKNVMSVMIAHLSFPKLEPDKYLASSLSQNIVDGLLINTLGFKGLIVTDALNMKGITKYYTTEQVAILCVKAGIDLILMPADEEKSIDAIEKAVLNNEISEERINVSVNKIIAAKTWAGLFDNKYVQTADVYKMINTAEAQQVAQQIADESITLVKDDNNDLPVALGNSSVTVFNIADVKDNANYSYFNEMVKQYSINVSCNDITESLTDSKITELVLSSKSSEIILFNIYAKVKFGTGKISIEPSHIRLLNELTASGKKVIISSFGNPYLLKNFENVSNYICTYSDSEVSINSFLKAINGDIKFKGKLPVTITDRYKFGTGLNK